MERRVIFRDAMDIDPADFNNLQDFARQSFDHIVGDAITADRKFAGFEAAAVSTVEISVEPGRFYSAGMVFVRDSVFSKNFATSLPLTTKKNVLVVVYGQETDTDVRPREFLTNEESGEAEPTPVAMERTRICSINTVAGQESPDPIDPLLDVGVLPVARIVLTPAGVATVEMLVENKLPSLAELEVRVGDLETFQATMGPKVQSIDADIANLKQASKGIVSADAYGRVLQRVAVLESINGVPADAVDSAVDFFLDTSESNLAHVNSLCKVDEGIRFADEQSANGPLQLFNPLDAGAKIVGGVLFPAYAREKRLAVGPRQSEVQVSALTYQTTEMVQKTMSRTRVRYGPEFTVCTNAGWWGAVTDQYIPKTFSHAGETFQTLGVTWDGPNHGWVRVRRYWKDVYEEPYWEAVTVDHSVPGAQIAETFLNANDMWLDAIGLTFTKLAPAGTVTLAVCDTDRGMPDLENVISVTTVDRASLALNAETVIPIQPVFLQGGKRYAFVVITAADHWLAMTGGANFPQGTFFTVIDGAYQQGDGTRDLCFTLYAAKFAQSRAVVQLNTLQLAGGMAAIDILADSVRPGSTDLSFEIQVNGIWYPLAPTEEAILGAGGNIPPTVPLRAVFTGTPSVMPCLRLTGSDCKVSRPRTNLTHISDVQTLPGLGSDEIHIITRYEYFDAAHHTATTKLRTGPGYNTIVNATSHTDVVEDDAVVRTWIFSLGAPVTSFVVQNEATTDSALATFHYAYRKYYALP